jgi:hypothetical protein
MLKEHAEMVTIPKSILKKLLKDPRLGGFEKNDRGNYVCVYRTSKGKACAVGCLISDETYNILERRNLKHLNINAIMSSVGTADVAAIIERESGLNTEQLRTLQATHDDFAFRRDRVTSVRRFFKSLLKDGRTNMIPGGIRVDITS